MDKIFSRARAIFDQQAFSRFIGARLTAFSHEGAEIRLKIRDELRQQDGFVHGGVLSYLADNVLTFAGGATLEGQIVTSELKLNYIRPAIGEELIGRGAALSSGRSQAVARCEIYCVEGGVERLCAAGQGTIVSMGRRAGE